MAKKKVFLADEVFKIGDKFIVDYVRVFDRVEQQK